jgi:hypothetical protein
LITLSIMCASTLFAEGVAREHARAGSTFILAALM